MRILESAPAPCLVCGRGNAQGSFSEDRPRFLDLERDVNWNDPAILCEDCCMQIGGMIGMLSGEERNALRLEKQNVEAHLHEVQSQADAMKRRAKKLGIEFVEVA